MPRTKGCGRKQKGSKHVKKKDPQPEDNPTNPPDPPDNRPTEDKGKDPPHPTFLPKEPNPSINLDSGSNVGLDVNATNVEDCGNSNNDRMETSISKPPTCTQLSTIVATPKKTTKETNMRKLPSSTQTLSVVSTPQKKCSTFATSTSSNRQFQ